MRLAPTAQLRAQAYADLETHLNALQTQLQRGQIADQDVLDAYSAFQVPAPALGEPFSARREAYLGSYVAHVALAHWLLARAWAYRGGTTFDLVSDRGVRGLQHVLERAEGGAHEGHGRAHEFLNGSGTGGHGTRYPTWLVLVRAVLHLLGVGH
ncbi:hypothetical protein [Deinococcus maricopensis]|uniref:Uncharacterized protein n=1 Tax=Deinococcus maricopensis (strain DSM 21211 / LMG 22137 / NRRL B-23946 / LB-34) TaxID=709986 RepID=E8U674_DEIML|nr:hypothetical protein [Deinococcus maricopensis]ADV66563.1 hypothetical protein Deima_0909 [Deinococcus maricopensis DSM 21211]